MFVGELGVGISIQFSYIFIMVRNLGRERKWGQDKKNMTPAIKKASGALSAQVNTTSGGRDI